MAHTRNFFRKDHRKKLPAKTYLALAEPEVERVLLIGSAKSGLGNSGSRVNRRNAELWVGVDFGRPRSASIGMALRKRRKFIIVEGRKPRMVHVAGVIDVSDNEQLRSWVSDPNNRLILVSVRSGQLEICDRLRRALTATSDTGLPPLLIIPCENRTDPSFRTLKGPGMIRSVVIADACMDRLCKSVDLKWGFAIVRTESFRYFGVEDVVHSDLENGSVWRRLIDAIGATIESDIRAVKFRKLLLFNGSHLVAGCRAILSGFTRLDSSLRKDRENLEFLEMTMAVFERAIIAQHPSLASSLAETARQYQNRMLGEKDTVDRIFNQLFEGDEEGFRGDWTHKIEGPLADVASELPGIREFIIELSLLLHRTLEAVKSR